MDQPAALAWRDVVDKHHHALLKDLSEKIDSGLREGVSIASANAARVQAESFNQALRRLRQAQSGEQILRSLLEGAAPSAERLVVLLFENNQVRSLAAHGLDVGETAFDISSAAALMSVIDTRDPIIALGTDSEISPTLATAFRASEGSSDEEKVYLFPIVSRNAVVAVLAAGGPAPAQASLELLCEAAGMKLETLVPARASKTNGELPAAEGVSPQKLLWDQLTPDDQKLHLQAQRMARVRVAEIRLNNQAQLRNGLARGDIYETLQRQIDSARDQFRRDFVSKSSTMVDYLHLEILRTLAHDDDKLLGERYPGPLV